LATTQIILLPWWFNKNNLIKKPNQKNPVKTIKFKTICPKWHFGQVGHGGKKTIEKVFLTKIPNPKGHDFL
jgi:hypothetical protein